jgi:hypothetical protein
MNSNSDSSISQPTSARVELASVEAVRALGLDMGLDEARLVHVALSGVIASGWSKSREKVAQMNRGVVACCRVEGMRDGELVAAAHPELSEFGWPSGLSAFRALGIDHRVLEKYWQRARRLSTDACLPLAWVIAFVPAPLWPAVLTVIRWGPAEAAARLEDAMVELAQRPVAIKTRRRAADARLSAGTLNTRVTAVHNLFAVLVGLRERALASRNPGLPVPLLEPWSAKPKRPDLELCGAVWANVDTAGPSLEQAQTLLRRLDADVAGAPRRSRYWRLRRRVLAGLLLVHGQRIEAIRDLDVGDYRRSHNFGDGVIGPALIYRPGKTRAADDVHILALPAELAGWLEEWVAYTGREFGDSGPLWPHRKPKPGQPIRRLNASAFARLVSGHTATDGTGSTPLLARGEDPRHGYNPHAYRHCAYQTMRRAGAQAKLEQPNAYLERGSDDFARAVVGHDLIRNLGDRYRDLDQQHLARVAIGYAWNDLRWRQPLHGPDPAAITDACERVELLRATGAELGADLDRLEQRQRVLEREHALLTGEARQAALFESNTLVFRLARLQHEIAATTERLDDAGRDLQGALVLEIEVDEDCEASYAEQLARARTRAAAVIASEAESGLTVTVRDVAFVLGSTTQTINAWIRRGFPRSRSKLWDEEAWTHEHGIRVLPISSLHVRLLSPIQGERLHLIRLRRTRLARARSLTA